LVKAHISALQASVPRYRKIVVDHRSLFTAAHELLSFPSCPESDHPWSMYDQPVLPFKSHDWGHRKCFVRHLPHPSLISRSMFCQCSCICACRLWFSQLLRLSHQVLPPLDRMENKCRGHSLRMQSDEMAQPLVSSCRYQCSSWMFGVR